MLKGLIYTVKIFISNKLLGTTDFPMNSTNNDDDDDHDYDDDNNSNNSEK
jgi:hypothetical protein